MQTTIHSTFANSGDAQSAEKILRSCVHCGFCNATCPTYLELGDERDGPRGRIYLIKQFLESGEVSRTSQRHLDRCLGCLACETTCPSGVEYGVLLDIGRDMIDQRVDRPLHQRFTRRLLRLIVPKRTIFAVLLRVGHVLRRILPSRIRAIVPSRQRKMPIIAAKHTRKVVLLDGCVQAAATPNTNAAASRVLDTLGISTVRVPAVGCCGAVSYHLTAHGEARDTFIRNIDALIPLLDSGVEKIVSSASGCTAMLKKYGKVMAEDRGYAELACKVADMTVDLSEMLSDEDTSQFTVEGTTPVALHCPCTLTHDLGQAGTLRELMQRCGVNLTQTRDDHLCCGSAGTYSILQPMLGRTFLYNKIDALLIGSPARIVTANVGCQMHISSASPVPVLHWVELLAECLKAP